MIAYALAAWRRDRNTMDTGLDRHQATDLGLLWKMSDVYDDDTGIVHTMRYPTNTTVDKTTIHDLDVKKRLTWTNVSTR